MNRLKYTPFSNDYAASWLIGGDLCKAKEESYQELREPQLSFPFLLISFSWMYKYTPHNKSDTQYAKDYLDGRRKPFKEITRQTYGKNSFTQVSYDFGDKFPSGVVNDRFHQCNDIMVSRQCQEQCEVSA